MTADTFPVTLAALSVYPIKSCGGVAVDEALVVESGLEFDRAWMLVDPAGCFVTQRELPRMALVKPTLRSRDMVLRAPGMLGLHVAFDAVEAPVQVTVWDDRVAAFDMGALPAQWFSDFLGRPLRLVRFDPTHERLSDAAWTGPIAAENAFSDGFPLLVASSASLEEFNRRLLAGGEAPVTLQRFRPNLVLDGLDAHAEDLLDEIVFDAAEGPVRLKLVKPCPRCEVPDVDPLTGVRGHAVSDVLASYRANPRVGGAVTFGMDAVIVEGVDRTLRAGMVGRAGWKFD